MGAVVLKKVAQNEGGEGLSCKRNFLLSNFFFQAEDGIRGGTVTGVQTCALPISVVAIESGLRPVRRREGRRENGEVVGCRSAGSAGEHVIRVPSLDSGLRSEERRVGKECRFRWARSY